MGHIFISYSHSDKTYVYALTKALEQEGFLVWLDDRIDYGTQWPETIEQQLDECDAFILVMSPRSRESAWVQNELTRAYRKKKRIFPLLLEGEEPWLPVETIQYIDVRGRKLPGEKFYKILASITPRLEKKIGAHSITATAKNISESSKIILSPKLLRDLEILDLSSNKKLRQQIKDGIDLTEFILDNVVKMKEPERRSTLQSGLEALDLFSKPVIIHASLKPFGYIQGGAEAVTDAILASFSGVIMPTFTYKTMVTPKLGPPNNGIIYESDDVMNKMAVPFHQNMPVDTMIGILPESFRNHPRAKRTSHPILSFAGIEVDEILDTQTLYEPLAPIRALAEQDGWVVLINVDHSVNTSIHYAEKLAGRRQFVRWALVGNRAVECPGFPGDSSGFSDIDEYIKPDTRRVNFGEGFVQAIPLKRLFDAVGEMIKKDPLALLCGREDCERCNAVRDYRMNQ
jgi:aminoglycoside 3-N-acetyltransferase